MPFPAFIETTRDGEKAYDVYTRMLKDRIVFLTGVVAEDMAIIWLRSFCCLNLRMIKLLS